MGMQMHTLLAQFCSITYISKTMLNHVLLKVVVGIIIGIIFNIHFNFLIVCTTVLYESPAYFLYIHESHIVI